MNGTGMKRKLAAVTGASSGIGWATAAELAERGYDLIVIARRENRLQELKALIEGKTSSKVHVLVADLSKIERLPDLAAKLAAHDVDLLVNNAGVGYYGNVLQQDPVRLADEAQVLVVALTFLTSAVGAQMAKRGGGTIVNISSGIAYASVAPGNAVYGAAKRYVWDFSRAVNHENKLLKNNVRCVSVQPGLVATELAKASLSDNTKPFVAGDMERTPADEFARAMVDGVESGRDDFGYGGLIDEIREAGKSQDPEIYIKAVNKLFGRKEPTK